MASSVTEGLSASTLAQFKVLQQRFVAGLPARWREIEAAPTPQSLQTALHRLAGSAGSYGFERMSQCAREAESLAASAANGGLAQVLISLQDQIGKAQSMVAADSPAGSA